MTQLLKMQDSVATKMPRLVVYLPPDTKDKLEKLGGL